MRQMSAKRAALQRQRVKRLRASEADQQRCAWPNGCTQRASDAHESLSRARGGDPIDPDWLLCRVHHDLVTSAHGELLAWCKTVGLIRSRYATVDNASQPTTLHDMAEADRTQIAIRLSTAGLARIDELAQADERSRSDMIRKLLSEAILARDVADTARRQAVR